MQRQKTNYFYDLRIPVKGAPFIRKNGFLGFDARLTDEERKFAVPGGSPNDPILWAYPPMPKQDWKLINKMAYQILIEFPNIETFKFICEFCIEEFRKITFSGPTGTSIMNYGGFVDRYARSLIPSYLLSLMIYKNQPKCECFHPLEGLMWVAEIAGNRTRDPLDRNRYGVDFALSRCDRINPQTIEEFYGKKFSEDILNYAENLTEAGFL